MTDEERRFEDFIRGIQFDDKPDLTHRDKLEKHILAAITERTTRQTNFWRIIMKSKITKLAAAAVIIIAVVIGVNMLKGTPAWAIGQSVKVLENIETITLSGKSNHIIPLGNFNILLKRDTDNWDSFRARVDSNDVVSVINGNLWYEYILGCGEIYAKDVEDFSDFGTNVWNEVIKNAPWMSPISPTMLKATKLMSSTWQETYAVDEQTGRNCVFVTGSYKSLSVSFWIVFDLESKLMVRAKYWTNPNRKGMPGVEIEKINYNEEISDEIFVPEKLAKVINKEERKERDALFNQANHLAGKKQYRESIEIFLQLYEKYPQFILTPVALQYIGECYGILGQHEKAIEFFEKVIHEYSAPKKTIADAYRLLGSSYMSIGKNTKALKDFEMGLEFITQWNSEGWRDYRETYRKEVEENIEKIKSKK